MATPLTRTKIDEKSIMERKKEKKRDDVKEEVEPPAPTAARPRQRSHRHQKTLRFRQR